MCKNNMQNCKCMRKINKIPLLVVFLDFANDRVCHAPLKAKLVACGFCQGIVDWVSDFLSWRQQRVVMGQHIADWIDVSSGVSQDSVLGSLLRLGQQVQERIRCLPVYSTILEMNIYLKKFFFYSFFYLTFLCVMCKELP